jgi:hypothetical protein
LLLGAHAVEDDESAAVGFAAGGSDGMGREVVGEGVFDGGMETVLVIVLGATVSMSVAVTVM